MERHDMAGKTGGAFPEMAEPRGRELRQPRGGKALERTGNAFYQGHQDGGTGPRAGDAADGEFPGVLGRGELPHADV